MKKNIICPRLGSLWARCIEIPGALIPDINRMHPAMMMSPDVCDCYNVWKGGNRLTLGLSAAKNTNYMKKISNQSCSDFHFLEKTQWAHMSIFPRPWSGASGLERLIWSKYYNAQKWQITFTSGQNVAKNTD